MERELWPLLYQLLQRTAGRIRQKYVQLQPWVIVATMLWAAIHDRPVSWACRAKHWNTTSLRPRRIPSAGTMSRRIDTVGTGLFWRALEQECRTCGNPALVSFLDGKPLPVGGNSKDPDAEWGRGAGGLAKGYKLHAVWSNNLTPDAWEVQPLKMSEKQAARHLIPQLTGGGYILADGEYDASDLYDLANERGYQLISPCRKAKHPGCGKHYQSVHRRHSIELLNRPFGEDLYRLRTGIERDFGNTTAFASGLAPLPAWVRGLDRVRTWVWAKLLINAARILRHQALRKL